MDGMIRRLDDLGRIVIPREIRAALGLRNGTPVEMSVREGGVFMEKYQPNANIIEQLEKLEATVDFSDLTCKNEVRHLLTEVGSLLKVEVRE